MAINLSPQAALHHRIPTNSNAHMHTHCTYIVLLYITCTALFTQTQEPDMLIATKQEAISYHSIYYSHVQSSAN